MQDGLCQVGHTAHHQVWPVHVKAELDFVDPDRTAVVADEVAEGGGVAACLEKLME